VIRETHFEMAGFLVDAKWLSVDFVSADAPPKIRRSRVFYSAFASHEN
jgi:hypothetical protein